VGRCQPPLRILVVEDEALIALDIECVIEENGHKMVGEAASLFDVAMLDDSTRPDLAFVDVHLASGTSGIDACRLIRERWSDATIVFITANPRKIPDDYAGAHGVIEKPFSLRGLTLAMKYLEEGICDPPPTSAQPACFMATPAFVSSWLG
jgi:CheY-like chemotaxis protein